MPATVRLFARHTADPQTVRFGIAFAAPNEGEEPLCAEAWLETGDGPALSLGLLVEPAPATWRSQRSADLTTFTYTGTGPYTARLLWGGALAEVAVRPGVERLAEGSAGPATQLVEFKVESPDGRAAEQLARWTVRGLDAGQLLRVDGGAIHACTARASERGEHVGECRLVYAKPGTYLVALDLLDAQGFWLATLAEYPVEVQVAEDEGAAPNFASPAAAEAYVPVADQPTADIVDSSQPSLPARYLRPLWGWLRTQSSPGGGSMVRVLTLGTYLGRRAETLIGEGAWYQTAGGDWVSANAVEFVQPSGLRGAELSAAPALVVDPAGWRGVVTAASLNVRSEPGVRAANPPREQLPMGTVVTVLEQTLQAGTQWYAIGSGRWVQADHVRPLAPRPMQPAATQGGRPEPGQAAIHTEAGTPAQAASNARLQPAQGRSPALPLGWVAAPALNVRPRPGIADGNTPVARVEHNQLLPVLDSCTLGGTPWYCISPDRWVEGAWVAVARQAARPSSIRPDERWLAISLAGQTLVAYEGDRPLYATMVATGAAGTPTPAGLFRVTRQAERECLAGGSPSRGNSYYLEDVPWLLYFHGGYALHGAYWHDSFGHPRSHGCVNLSLHDAWWLYRWQAMRIWIY